MLRYKNSLLERILLEKGEAAPYPSNLLSLADISSGIDVQAELRVKTEGSHVLSHPASSSANAQSSAVHKAFINRNNQVRRTASGSAVKPIRPQQLNNIQSSRSQSITSSTMSPIAAKSPHGVGKGGIPDNKGPVRPQPQIQPRTHPQQGAKHLGLARSGVALQAMTPSTDGGRGSEVGSNPGTQPSFYPPEYQAHLDQLGKCSLDARGIEEIRLTALSARIW